MQDYEDQLAQEEYEQQQAEQAENEASESDDNSNGPGSIFFLIQCFYTSF
jgi:hypothetical protein